MKRKQDQLKGTGNDEQRATGDGMDRDFGNTDSHFLSIWCAEVLESS